MRYCSCWRGGTIAETQSRSHLSGKTGPAIAVDAWYSWQPNGSRVAGGLLINELFPGPDLFTIHASVTWTFIYSLLVGQVFMMIFGLMIARCSIFVTRIPNHAMAAASFFV